MVTGEVHTGLLQHSVALTPDGATALLDLVPGEPVRRSHRPLSRAQSPELLTGVDCEIPVAGKATRAVGTVLSRAVITGGHVLQGSAFAHIADSPAPRRLSWPHYLSRPGRVELLTARSDDALAEGLLAGPRHDGQLRLSAIGDHAYKNVLRSDRLDRRPPLRLPVTRLSWVAREVSGSEPAGLHLTVRRSHHRTLLIRQPDLAVSDVTVLCEDIAYHDWLLSSVISLVAQARIGGADRDATITRLKPVVDHLLHLWMPAAHCNGAMRQRWRDLERTPGFSRQWTALVNRIRDQLTLAMLGRTSRASSPF
ncbi:SCO2521 family protein [Stackebrandtia albiflava]|nr:SCO2521 family protein [Stackebrandtia albiflava]